MTKYKRIGAYAYRKIIVVGDLHGCYDEFMQLLDACNFDQDTDLVVSVGDLIDRGPKNVECIALIKEPWFKAVKGNHDDMAVQALMGGNVYQKTMWIWNGGAWMLDSDEFFKNRHAYAKQLEQLPDVIELEFDDTGRRVVVCHADYPSGEYKLGKEIDRKDLIWSRDRIECRTKDITTGADLFIHGHTIVDSPKKLGNHLYIDTGCFGTGKLTAAVFYPAEGVDYELVTISDGKVS